MLLRGKPVDICGRPQLGLGSADGLAQLYHFCITVAQ